jgi:hypothetical protein
MKTKTKQLRRIADIDGKPLERGEKLWLASFALTEQTEKGLKIRHMAALVAATDQDSAFGKAHRAGKKVYGETSSFGVTIVQADYILRDPVNVVLKDINPANGCTR